MALEPASQRRARRAESGAAAEASTGEASWTAPSHFQQSYGNQVVFDALSGATLGGLGGLVAGEIGLDAAGVVSHEAPSNSLLLGLWRDAVDDAVDWNHPAVRQLRQRGGHPLPATERSRMESAFQHDFGHVRIHTDSQAAQAAQALQAHAFALGAHVFFGPGTWAPGTPGGDRLLAHELTHVVQHDEGRLPGGGGVSDPSDRAEQEAYGNEDRILGALDAPGPIEAPAAPDAEQTESTPSTNAGPMLRRDPSAEAWIRRSRGEAIPDEVAARLGGVFGSDLGRVRVHTDAAAARAAEAMQARAFTLGAHVFFAEGEWQPSTAAGLALLAHEVTHVVQHAEGRLPDGDGVSDPSHPAEQEARAIADALDAKPLDADPGASSNAPVADAAVPDGAIAWRDEDEDDDHPLGPAPPPGPVQNQPLGQGAQQDGPPREAGPQADAPAPGQGPEVGGGGGGAAAATESLPQSQGAPASSGVTPRGPEPTAPPPQGGHTADTPQVSMPDPVGPTAATPHPDLDAFIAETTGMTVQGHQHAIQGALDDVVSEGEALQSQMIDASLDAATDVSSEIAAVQVSVDTTVQQATGDIGATHDQVGSQVDAAFSEGVAAIDRASAASDAALQGARDATVTQLHADSDGLAQDLTNQQTGWEEQFSAAIEEAAGRVESQGADFHREKQAEAQRLYDEGKVAVDPGDTPSAAHIVETQRLFGVEEAKKVRDRYIAKIPDMTRLAATHLRQEVDVAAILGEALHVPTIEDLYPRVQETEHSFVLQIEDTRTEQERQEESARRGMSEQQVLTHLHLNEQRDRQEQEASEAGEVIDGSLQDAQDGIAADAQQGAADIDQQNSEDYAQFAAMLMALDEVPDGRALIGDWAEETANGIQAAQEEGTNAIREDEEGSLAQVDAQANQRRRALQQGVQDQNQAVGEEGAQIARGTGESAQGVADDVLNQTRGVTAYTEEQFAEVRQGMRDSAVLSAEQSAVFRGQLQLQLDGYVEGSMQQLQALMGHMDTAVAGAVQSAGGRARTEINDTVDKVFEAVDGLGTDESMLLRGLEKITNGVHGKAARYEYGRSKTNEMWDDVYDDTSGSLWQACRNYMLGNRSQAALHALDYASGWQNWYAADTETIEATLRNLDETERQALLAHEDFPAIQQQVQVRLESELRSAYSSPIGALAFGGNQYDIDVFNALTDASITRDDALIQADGIRLAEAFNGNPGNPFTWGTDEDAARAIMERTSPENMARLDAAFTQYANDSLWVTGESLEEQIGDEFSGPERDYLLALRRGDRDAAQAHRLAMATDEGHMLWRSENADDAITLLSNPDLNNDGDWLAQQEARDTRLGMISQFEENYTADGVTADSHIREVFDGGEGEDDNRADELIAELLATGQARAEHFLAYGMIGAGTREQYVRRAFQEMRGPADWERCQAFFREHYGITDLEAYLGIGEHRGADDISWTELIVGGVAIALTGGAATPFVVGYFVHRGTSGPELSGQDAFDVDQLYQGMMADRRRVPDVYNLARNNWEFYRGEGAGIAGGAVMSLTGHRSGDLLDDHFNEMTALFQDHSWWDRESGTPSQDPAAQNKWARFNELAGYLDRNSAIYQRQLSSMTEAITGVIAVIGAAIVTIATAGFGAPAAVGVLIGLGVAAVTIAVRASMLGDAYGQDQMLIDIGRALADAIVGIITGGIGNWGGLEGLMKGVVGANPGLGMRLLSTLVTSLPGAVVSTLSDPAVWESNDPLAAAAGAIGIGVLKALAGSLAEGMMEDGLGEQVGRMTRRVLTQMASETAQVLVDPNIMQGDNIGWELLKANLRAAATAAIVQQLRNNAVTYLNSRTELSADDWRRVMGTNEDYRNEILGRLDDGHLQRVPARYRDRVPSDLLARVTFVEEDAPPAPTPTVTTEDDTTTTTPTTSEEETPENTTTPTTSEEETPETTTTTVTTTGTETDGAGAPTETTTAVDPGVHRLNNLDDAALRQELMAVHRIGPELADRIVAERRRNGPFTDSADLATRVRGIGDVLSGRIHQDLGAQSDVTPQTQPRYQEVEATLSQMVDSGQISAEQAQRIRGGANIDEVESRLVRQRETVAARQSLAARDDAATQSLVGRADAVAAHGDLMNRMVSGDPAVQRAAQVEFDALPPQTRAHLEDLVRPGVSVGGGFAATANELTHPDRGQRQMVGDAPPLDQAAGRLGQGAGVFEVPGGDHTVAEIAPGAPRATGHDETPDAAHRDGAGYMLSRDFADAVAVNRDAAGIERATAQVGQVQPFPGTPEAARAAGWPDWAIAQGATSRVEMTLPDGRVHFDYHSGTVDVTSGPGRPRVIPELTDPSITSPTTFSEMTGGAGDPSDPSSRLHFADWDFGPGALPPGALQGETVGVIGAGPAGAWAGEQAAQGGAAGVVWMGWNADERASGESVQLHRALSSGTADEQAAARARLDQIAADTQARETALRTTVADPAATPYDRFHAERALSGLQREQQVVDLRVRLDQAQQRVASGDATAQADVDRIRGDLQARGFAPAAFPRNQEPGAAFDPQMQAAAGGMIQQLGYDRGDIRQISMDTPPGGSREQIRMELADGRVVFVDRLVVAAGQDATRPGGSVHQLDAYRGRMEPIWGPFDAQQGFRPILGFQSDDGSVRMLGAAASGPAVGDMLRPGLVDPEGRLVDAQAVRDNLAFQAGRLSPDSRGVVLGFEHSQQAIAGANEVSRRQRAAVGQMNQLDAAGLATRLAGVQGVEPALAERIVAARQAGGPFRDMADLRRRVPSVDHAVATRITHEMDLGSDP